MRAFRAVTSKVSRHETRQLRLVVKLPQEGTDRVRLHEQLDQCDKLAHTRTLHRREGKILQIDVNFQLGEFVTYHRLVGVCSAGDRKYHRQLAAYVQQQQR